MRAVRAEVTAVASRGGGERRGAMGLAGAGPRGARSNRAGGGRGAMDKGRSGTKDTGNRDTTGGTYSPGLAEAGVMAITV